MFEFFGFFLPISLPILAIGGIAFVIIAIVQEAKTSGRAEAIRSAFTYVVSLAMLLTVVGSTIFLLQQVARVAVFPNAERPNSYIQPPPTLYLSSSDKGPALYACTDACQFNDADREQLTIWTGQYQQWKQAAPSSNARYSTEDKRQTVNAISFLIVALPLFWWFFLRMGNREARRVTTDGPQKLSPLRSAYFYLVAFTGLVGLVASGAMLLNVALKNTFGLQTDKQSDGPVPLERSIVGSSPIEKYGVKSVVNCADKCGFSTENRQLAEEWQSDYDRWQKENVTYYPRRNNIQTDLANFIPILLISGLMFFYHFVTVRREGKGTTPSTPTGI